MDALQHAPPSKQKHRVWEWPNDLSVMCRQFLSAEPYPHLVVDDMFSIETLWRLYGDVPVLSSPLWTHWGSGGPENCIMENSKRGISSLMLLSKFMGDFLKQLTGDVFLRDLREITGCDDLAIDPTFNGGGLHCTGRGGYLRIHADKVRHPRPFIFDQAVNLILFINPHWVVEFGGALELWSRDGNRRIVSIPALFKRMVIFKSDRSTYHGHPDPMRCPAGMYRTSLAVYYYVPRVVSIELPDNEIIWKQSGI